MSQQELPLVLSFLGGSLSSCFAEFLTFPMDMLKTRMQLGGTQGMEKFTSMRQCIISTYNNYGLVGYYKGVSTALIRQLIYSGLRIAIYDKLKSLVSNDEKSGSKFSRFAVGGCGGGIASLLTTPLDVAKIRLINDPFRKQYRGFIDTLYKTYTRDGFFNGFYKGSSPNVYRALVVNAVELGTYDNAKGMLIKYLSMKEDSITLRFWSSILAGLAAALVTSPIDVVKTRYMNSTKGGSVYFTSPYHCVKTILRNEGFFSLYNGFLLSWLRLGPWCVFMFLSWEFYKDKVSYYYKPK